MNFNNIAKYIYYRLKFRNKLIKMPLSSRLGGFDSKLEGHNSLGQNTFFAGELGYGSYMGSNCVIYGKIGRYCSIADHVKVISGKHPTSGFVSTHPAFFSTRKQAGFTYINEQLYEEIEYADDKSNIVLIGNDVWVGYGSVILGGISIGDGAVIAAGAVITKDIQPYTIMAGVPAKLVKKRFSDEQIEKLLKIKWWDKSAEWVENHAKQFCNINTFIKNNKLTKDDNQI